MKKSVIFSSIVLLIGIFIFGCTEKNEQVKQSEKKLATDIKKPEPNKVTSEQAKHPLPKDSQPFTGKVVKVVGQKVIVDVKGGILEFEITKDTNLQKGNKVFSGKIEALKPGLEINVLTQKGVALAVQYKG